VASGSVPAPIVVFILDAPGIDVDATAWPESLASGLR
jgi:hypothetical protein